MFAHKLCSEPTAKLTSKDREILHQYKSKALKKYSKEVLSNDYLLDICSMALAELLADIDETELVSCSALLGFEKPIRITLEKLMFNLHDEVLKVKDELQMPYRIYKDSAGGLAIDLNTGSGRHTAMLKQLSGYSAHMVFLNDYAPFEAHLRLVQLTKAIIWRHTKKTPTLASSICRSPGFRECLDTIHGRVGDDYNTPGSLLAYMAMIVMICRKQGQDLPLVDDLVDFTPANDYYRRYQENVIAAVKNWNLNDITDMVQIAKAVIMTFILNYVDLYQGFLFMKDSGLCHLLQHPVAFPTYEKAMPNTYDTELATLMDELELRNALLPSNGVEYSIAFKKVKDSEGDSNKYIGVPDEICSTHTFYLHEIITEDNQLYLIIRQYNHELGHSQLYVYKPTEKKIEFISRYRDRDGGMYCDCISFCVALKIYKSALGLFARHNGDGKGDGDEDVTQPKNVHKSILYKEQRYIQHYMRRLPDGHSPSMESMEAARAIGLVLDKQQTYVKPHWKSVGRTTIKDAVVAPVLLTGLLSCF